MRIFKSLGKKGVSLIWLSVLFIVANVWLELKSPEYMQEITLLVTSTQGEMGRILSAGGNMFLCCLGSLLCSLLVAVFAARLSADFSTDLRARIYYKVQSFSMEEMSRFSVSGLITRSTNDITQVRMLLVMGLQVIIKAPIMAVWAIGKISLHNGRWTLSTGISLALLLTVLVTCLAIATPKFRRLQKLTDDLNRVTRENLSGLRVVRAYNGEAYQEGKFAAVNDSFVRTHLFAGRTMAFLMPSIQLIMSGSSLAIYWIGAFLISRAQMEQRRLLFAEMSVFSQYSMQVMFSFMMLVIIFMILPRALISIRRINEVLDTKNTLLDGMYEGTEDERRGEIAFREVSFRYPDAEEAVLQNISFTVQQGQTFAIIGATGSGKSSLINLIPRFYDVSEGAVLVNGVDVRRYRQRALRKKIGYISQRAVLFSGTVASNLTLGEGDEGLLGRALTTAQASEFVDNLPQGAESHVAQGGNQFSGGQKQRLSIASALARKAEILIFDDSFSALDYATDRTLRRALREQCAGVTKIIVAQRIGTIRDADKILVLDEGRAVGMGTHRELMETCEVYRQIAASQHSEEEAV
jgi:ATP-binding cassette subfamily B protein